MKITMPFPPSSLSGHANGHWRSKSQVVKKWREDAFWEAKARQMVGEFTEPGDIPIHFRFIPPDNRGDRTNYPNRLKPIIDGIADALGINDKRFLPSYEFLPPEKPGRIEITIGGNND